MWRLQKWPKSFIVVVIPIVFFRVEVLFEGNQEFWNIEMEDVYVIVNDAFYENYLGGNLCKFPDFF